MKRAVFIALALMCACGDDDPLDAPDPKLMDAAVPIDMQAMLARSALVKGSHALVQRGYECGYSVGWQRTIEYARHQQPGVFRAKAMGRAWTFGLVALVAGMAATFFLAWLLPRLARRKQKREAEASAPRTPTWPMFFKSVALRAVQRVGRVLHVELFDPVIASQRTQATYAARDIERQLSVGRDSIHATSDAAIGLKATLEGWKAEVEALRVRLEGDGGLPRELSAERVLPRLEDVRRAARDIRVGLERAVIMGATLDEGAWLAWQQRVNERPPTPRQQVGDADLLPKWVKPLGWGGLGALMLAVPMMAAWMAAGAFPLFFAFVFAFGGLALVAVARIYLARAGRMPLLPGFADRVASWLTTVSALAFAAMVLSSWTSSESGLDLGDAPPLPLPDPGAMEPKEYWWGAPLDAGDAGGKR